LAMGFIFCRKDTNNPPNRKKIRKKRYFSSFSDYKTQTFPVFATFEL